MPSSRSRVRRHWTFWVGVLLVLSGVGLLGYVGWQMYVTNLLSQREHAAIVDRLREEWRNGGQSSDGAGDGPGTVAVVDTDAGTATAILRVPRFGEDYAVPILAGVEDDALAAGVGHFEGTADPGGKGNYALAAHRVTHGEPFRDMPELQVGDEVVVETREATYTYVLDTAGDALTVTFTDTWVIDPRPVNPDGGVGPVAGERRLITLTTCSELFHTDNRLIAFGHLVSTEETG